MTFLTAAVIGVLFGSGAYLMLKADLFRVVVGVVLVSNAASLALMGASQSRGRAAIYPLGGDSSDPLTQAMTLTALVIGFAVTALLLGLAYRVSTSHDTVDLEELSRLEAREEERVEVEEPAPEEDEDVAA